MEYISLHRCIRKTPSDTDLAEHMLRMGRSIDNLKRIYRTTQN